MNENSWFIEITKNIRIHNRVKNILQFLPALAGHQLSNQIVLINLYALVLLHSACYHITKYVFQYSYS